MRAVFKRKLHFTLGDKVSYTSGPPGSVEDVPDWVLNDDYFKLNLADGNIDLLADTIAIPASIPAAKTPEPPKEPESPKNPEPPKDNKADKK